MTACSPNGACRRATSARAEPCGSNCPDVSGRLDLGRLRLRAHDDLGDSGGDGDRDRRGGIAYGLGGTAAAGMIKDLAERMIVGRDPARIEALWSEMYDHSFWAKGGGAIVFAGSARSSRRSGTSKARCSAFQSRAARRKDRRTRSASTRTAGTVPAETPAEFAERRRAAAARRLSRLEVLSARRARRERAAPRQRPHGRPRRSRTSPSTKIKALRNAVGPEVELMLDLSGGLTTAETIRLCSRFEELDIAWIEEPADPFDVGALKKISEHVKHPDRRRRAHLHAPWIPQDLRAAGGRHRPA